MNLITPGVCRVCGASSDDWIDDTRTLCSRCASQADLVAAGLRRMAAILRQSPRPGPVQLVEADDDKR